MSPSKTTANERSHSQRTHTWQFRLCEPSKEGKLVNNSEVSGWLPPTADKRSASVHKCQLLCHKEVVTAARSSPYTLDDADCTLKTVNFCVVEILLQYAPTGPFCALNGCFTTFCFVNSCTSYPEKSDSPWLCSAPKYHHISLWNIKFIATTTNLTLKSLWILGNCQAHNDK